MPLLKMKKTSCGLLLSFISLLLASKSSSAWSQIPQTRTTQKRNNPIVEDTFRKCLLTGVIASSLLISTLPSFADEIGKETEAPTLSTGETVMVSVANE